MPLSSVLGASSVIKPGVCTSTTRPSVPYEGQLIYETDTDRVASYNGSAWVYTHSSGLVVVKSETAFSTASSVTADGVFTSSYTNYMVIVRYETNTTNSVFFKLRVSASSASTNYNYQTLAASDTTLAGARSTSQTSAFAGTYTNGAFPSLITMTLCGPQLAASTQFSAVDSHNLGAFTAIRYGTTVGNHSTATAYDGIELLVTSGTMTGSYTIYGYSK